MAVLVLVEVVDQEDHLPLVALEIKVVFIPLRVFQVVMAFQHQLIQIMAVAAVLEEKV